MADKLTSLTGFGEGDPKPDKNRALSSINRHARRHGERLSTTEAGEKKYHARKVGVKLSAKEQNYGSAKSKALSRKSGGESPFSKTTGRCNVCAGSHSTSSHSAGVKSGKYSR